MRGMAHKILRRLGRESQVMVARAAPAIPWLRPLRSAVQSSGLFDDGWYLAQNPDVGELGLDPLDHFVAIGGWQLRDPGPHFSSSEAFVRLGRAEEIPLLTWLREKPFEPAPVPCAPLLGIGHYSGPASLRVGFVVHAWYEDQIDTLLGLTQPMQTPVAAYVAVHTEEGEKAAFRHRDRFVSLTVSRVVNRGRNTGTWCALFGPRILEECDVFCHVHSKRSLHLSARASALWRQRTYANLFGDDGLADQIVHQFELDPQLGIVSPAPPSDIDMVHYADAANAHEIERLFGILGLDSGRSEFYDYPVGNMFWARSAALRQLLDGRITHDLFPEESGQLDGTLAHAIERSVGLVAKANGFRYDEVDARSQRIRIGMGGRNLWSYPARASSRELRRLVQQHPVVVVEADGLVFTRAVPRSELWRQVGARLGLSEYGSWRRAAESCWPDQTLFESLAQHTDRAEEALDLERQMEREMVRPLTALMDRLHHQAFVVAEHGADLIRDARHRGVLQVAEPGVGPRQPEYWNHLAEKLEAKPEEILYISSNLSLLGSLPASMKIQTLRLLDPWNLYALRRDQGAAPAGWTDQDVLSRFGDPFEGR